MTHSPTSGLHHSARVGFFPSCPGFLSRRTTGAGLTAIQNISSLMFIATTDPDLLMEMPGPADSNARAERSTSRDRAESREIPNTAPDTNHFRNHHRNLNENNKSSDNRHRICSRTAVGSMRRWRRQQSRKRRTVGTDAGRRFPANARRWLDE